MQVADSLLDLVGHTPLVRLRRVGADLPCDLIAKVELFNPGGSVKDRPAIAMIDDAERQGLLKPGGTAVGHTTTSAPYARRSATISSLILSDITNTQR